MLKFRQDKTTPNEDGFKVLVVGIMFAIVILVMPPILTRLSEFRWYRDIVRITPFYNVELYYSSVVNNNTKIIFGGTMTKRTCKYDHLVGYVTGQFGQRHRVKVDTSVEDLRGVTGSRPPSSNPETWGPWSIDISNIKVFNQPLQASNFEVVAFHIKCPTEPVEQSNDFISAPWGNFSIKVPTTKDFDFSESIVIEKEE